MSGDRGGDNQSRARDHLANERTYLAWLRTAANVMVFGLVVARFGPSSPHAVEAGVLLIAVGIIGLVHGTFRYRQVNGEIERGEYVTGSRGRAPVIASAVLIGVVIAALALLGLGSHLP